MQCQSPHRWHHLDTERKKMLLNIANAMRPDCIDQIAYADCIHVITDPTFCKHAFGVHAQDILKLRFFPIGVTKVFISLMARGMLLCCHYVERFRITHVAWPNCIDHSADVDCIDEITYPTFWKHGFGIHAKVSGPDIPKHNFTHWFDPVFYGEDNLVELLPRGVVSCGGVDNYSTYSTPGSRSTVFYH